MYSIRHVFRRAFASICPLCDLSAQGEQLCAGCLNDILRSLHQRPRCAQCAGALVSEASTGCAGCLRNRPAFTHTVTAMTYAYPSALVIRALKERGQLAQATLCAHLLDRSIKSHPRYLPPLAALVPIPSGRSSLLHRGFNPAAEIARALSALLHVPLRQSWLARAREADLQKSLDACARRENVKGVFACPERLPRVWIGVVDDVLTSGSTMHAASQALLGAGACGVVALVAARTPWKETEDASVNTYAQRKSST